jgi:uncharacterized membrane protein
MYYGPHIDMAMVFWIVICIIVVASIVFRYLASVSRDRTIRDLAERGQTISPDMFLTRGGGGSLFGGIFMLFIGIALVVFLYFLSGHIAAVSGNADVPRWLPVVGIFPIAIGLALIVGRMLDRRDIDRR